MRSSKRSTKSIVEQPPVEDSQLPEPEEDQSSPGEHSFIYSPSRRRTRGEQSTDVFVLIWRCVVVLNLRCVCVSAHRAESPGPSQESLTLVTRRSRRRVKDADPQVRLDLSFYSSCCCFIFTTFFSIWFLYSYPGDHVFTCVHLSIHCKHLSLTEVMISIKNNNSWEWHVT